MFKRQLTLVAIALLFSLPTAAIANDINVRVGNVRVNTGDGDVQVDVDPSSNRYRSRSRRYCHKYKRNGRYYYKCYRRSSSRYYEPSTIYYPAESRGRRVYCDGDSTYSRQDVSQISGAGVTIVESSVSSGGCY